jgi:ribonuclease T2
VDWTNKNAPTDSFLLVLSWSPEYCAHPRNNKRSPEQCRDNRFDFVIHGLWPQSMSTKNKFSHPRYCKESGVLSQEILKRHFCSMPSVELMQEQWSRHGTCAFPTPDAYFEKIDQLWQALHTPDLRRLQTAHGDHLTAGDIARAFAEANRRVGLTEDAIAVRAGKGNTLREVLICYNKGYAFQRCMTGRTPHHQKIRIRF